MSAALEPFAGLLQELGGLDDSIERITQSAEDAYELRYADGTDVLIEWRQERGVYLLDVSIGGANPDARLPIYELLLNQNLVWREHGTLRLGLAGKDGDIVLSASLPGDRRPVSSWHAALQEFLRLASDWRDVVAGMADPNRSAQGSIAPADLLQFA